VRTLPVSPQVWQSLLLAGSASRHDAKVRIHLLTSIAGATNRRTTRKHTTDTMSIQLITDIVTTTSSAEDSVSYPSFTVKVFALVYVYHERKVNYRVGQKTGLFLEVCNSRIC